VGFNLHRGVVAAVERAPALSVAAVASGARALVALERLNDIENLGALFRNARAFGVDGVLLDPETADPRNRRSVRVSLGHVLRVPFARCTADEWPLRLPGCTIAALTPAGDVDVRDLVGEPVALVLGAEGPGLSEAALAAADVRVRIPMADRVDSLNVAVAAAVALYEVFSRR
jgi:tRNA G18 (ribose-2'-O)-methylase SpoU